MVELRWLKDYKGIKKGDIANASGKSAENFVSQGYAEYVSIDEELERREKLHSILKEKENSEDPELTYEQRRGIILNNEKDIEYGRKKQNEEIVNTIIVEEKISEEKEKEILEKERLKKLEDVQKEYERLQRTSEGKLYLLKMNIISLLAQKKRREATELIVDNIKENNYIYTTKEDMKSEMWIYQDGVYKPNGKSHITEVCRKILNEHFTTHLVGEVISKIEADTYIESEEFFKNNYVDQIPVDNGILNVKTKKLHPFNPKKIFFNKIPVKYNPKSKCKYVKKHFEDVLKNKSDVDVMFEIFGFFLYKDYFIEKAIMFVGDGRNGKGKTIDLMKRFLGIDNCCSVSLNLLSDGGFRTWDLFGKMANLAGDLSSNALKDTAMLKQTTGRDLIGADRKNKTTVNFVNYAKHIFACNELPRVYDFSRGFWERWVLFEFPYTFVKKDVYEKLNEEEKKKHKIMDVFIIEKLTQEEELSGLLNEAIEGLHRLIKQKDFSYSTGVNEIKQFWVRKSDSFTAFAMDHLEESYDGVISKQKLRKAFLKYCKEHKIRGASDKNIKVVLEEMFGATDRQDYETKNRLWEGIKFKEKSAYNYMGGKLTQG